jgi:uncharacterized protein involved in exopolysaccharide biosynthesis
MKQNKLLLLILKEKNLIAGGFIVGLLAFFFYLLFMHVFLFKTETKVFIRNIPKEDIITPLGGGATIVSESGFSNPLFNIVQIIESDTVADQVYPEIKDKYAPDLEKLGVRDKKEWLQEYKHLLSARIKPSTDIIEITLNWPNKKTADAILEEVVKEFKVVNLEIGKSVESKKSLYLEEQLIGITSQLDNIRKRIRNYKVENKAIDLTNETSELTKARVELQKEVELLKSKIHYYDRKLTDFSKQLNFPNAQSALRAVSIGEDPYLVELSQDLANAQQEYAQLKSRFTDNYPDVIAVKNEIQELKDNISIRKKETLGDVNVDRGVYDQSSQQLVKEMATVQAEKTSLRAQLATLQSGIEKLKEQESSLPSKVMGLEELQKQEKALAEAYESVKQKQMEANIKENEIVDNIIVLDNPSKPRFIYITLLTRFTGLIGIALLFALAVATLKEDIENKWIDSTEIEDITGKQVLGVIPWINSQELMDKDKSMFIQRSDSIMGVSYGEIVTNIIRSSYRQDAQAISFVSTVPSRHTSNIIPNITATLARLNKSVIYIVTDYSDALNLMDKFGVSVPKNKKDMLDVIDRVNIHLRISKTIDNNVLAELLEEAFVPVLVEGNEIFHFLHTQKAVNIYDYVGTRGFTTIIDFLKQYYEFIIIDTPSKPLVFPEFSAISGVSDGVVIIAAMETNRDGLIRTINRFDKSETKVLGIIAREENNELEAFFTSKMILNGNNGTTR